eukprot:CAMPEP_0177697784 /NCGR_PEP_ID=MMETSP0484_2-20121128/4695_1 /TAXON_ID=354590 /ORGANISM="Rhodomonas lens, Strain RHODO" /LENGTH=149 /DNA_ID=CAMNT_0019208839 /DNA_START=305 /DNA_END=752 /DNA_ORIENTATION=+
MKKTSNRDSEPALSILQQDDVCLRVAKTGKPAAPSSVDFTTPPCVSRNSKSSRPYRPAVLEVAVFVMERRSARRSGASNNVQGLTQGREHIDVNCPSLHVRSCIAFLLKRNVSVGILGAVITRPRDQVGPEALESEHGGKGRLFVGGSD